MLLIACPESVEGVARVLTGAYEERAHSSFSQREHKGQYVYPRIAVIRISKHIKQVL